jgi:cell pole-organizing protein PopZ
MLKTWLDDNLPGIVKRLVSAEIERVARRDGAAWHESGENLSLSKQLGGCEEAEGAEHWRYEDTAVGSREAGPPFEEIRSRRPLYLMAAMIVAGLACIGASFGFKGAVSPQDATTKDASILGGSPQQPPVAVVNNVEQPADLTAPANLPEAQANPPRAIAGLTTGAASVPVPAPPAQAQPQPSAEPLSVADLIEPKKVKTVSVRPDGTLLPNDAPPPVTAAAVPVPAATPKSGGSRETWYSRTTGRKFSVPRNTKMVHTANGVLKSAGLPKAF